MDLARFAAHAFTGMAQSEPEGTDPTSTRILDAALQEAAARGLRAMTAEGVARRAGVSRVTVYRRFDGRDGVLAATAMREGHRIAAAVQKAVADAPTPSRQLVDGFAAAISAARDHPLISRLASLEPEELIAAGLANDAALLRLGADLVAEMIRDLQAEGFAQHVDADESGETLTRLFAALLIIPAQHSIDLSTDQSTREYVRRTLGPMLLGPSFE